MVKQFLSGYHHVRTMSSNLWRVLRLLWGTSRGPLVLVLSLMLLSGLIPALQLQLTRLMVQTAQFAIVAHGAASLVWAALSFGLIQAALSLLSSGLGAGQNYLQSLMQLQVIKKISLIVMEKSCELDIEHFEDDQLYDKLQRVSQESQYQPTS